LRADRLSHFKERLRQGAENFEFTALIDGVSTLDETAQADSPVAPFVAGLPSLLEDRAPALPPMIRETSSPAPESREEDGKDEVPLAESSGLTQPLRTLQTVLEIPVVPPVDIPADLLFHAPQSDRLRTAISDLAQRLAGQASELGIALSARDVDASGVHLARLNHILELLHSIDPDGEQARRMQVVGAPPAGRSWPGTTWSVFEFAESPVSGLLPPEADQEFVNSVLYASWGVAFE
jgi:hypothetical protein